MHERSVKDLVGTKINILDERMKVIIVDSVKGGCGKTSISLKYAAMLAQKNEKVCYIDLDILGSSIETFINGINLDNLALKSMTEEVNENYSGDSEPSFQLYVDCPARFHLNEIFKGQSFSPRFFNRIKVTEKHSVDIHYFDLIACNPDQDEKDLFKPSKLMNYVGQIDYEYFAAMIKNILDELKSERYTYIIIDMPPNSDAYTDSVFNILLRADESGKEMIKNLEYVDSNEAAKYNVVTKYNVEICIVNSLDRAHFEANLLWLRAMIDERRMEWALDQEQNFKIVFNNNSVIENELNESQIKKYLDFRLLQLKELSIKKVTRFDYDRQLAESAMNNCVIGFGSLRESELKCPI